MASTTVSFEEFEQDARRVKKASERGPVFELEKGVLSIERRDRAQGAVLREWLEDVLLGFAGRILPVDLYISMRCAALHVPKTQPENDAWIAATALVHEMTVVTRNVADFQPMGVAVLNPWEYWAVLY